jgi:hypothetical protein
MSRAWTRIASILMILTGAIWLAQGMRLLPSQVMYGSPFWGTLGGILLLAGLALAYWGFIRRA